MARDAVVIGAGLSGLAAAVALAEAGWKPRVFEAGPQAGGRCRSYHDAVLGMRIDNGNHLLLSGNRHAMRFLRTIGAQGSMTGPSEAAFPFADLGTGERWVLRPNSGKLPWWLLVPSRRVPGTGAADYLQMLRLAFARPDDTVAFTLKRGPLFRRLWEPLAVSALNTQVEDGSSRLFWRIVRETLGAGGSACLPLVPREGLSESFIDPAIAYIESHGGTVRLGRRLTRLGFDGAAVRELVFADGAESVAPTTPVVLAVTAPVAAGLVPGLDVPQAHRGILNLHYRVETAYRPPGFIGVVGGTAEWVFQKPGILSVTISAADRLMDRPADVLALEVWSDLRRLYPGLPETLPPHRVVKEKRATFAATPAEARRRPPARTRWHNLLLAGDWTATGLPGTIEGSLRSGYAAAAAILRAHPA